MDYFFNRSFTLLEPEDFDTDTIKNLNVLQFQNTLNEAKKDSSIIDLSYFSDFMNKPIRPDKYAIDVLLTENQLFHFTNDSIILDSIFVFAPDSLPMLDSLRTADELVDTLNVYQFALTNKYLKHRVGQTVSFNFSSSNIHNFTNNTYSYALKIGTQHTFQALKSQTTSVEYVLSASDSICLPITIQWKIGTQIVAEKTQLIKLSAYQAISPSVNGVGTGINENPEGFFEVSFDGYTATAFYDLACGESDFTHPLIYVEGYDLGGDFSYTKAYYQIDSEDDGEESFLHTYNPNNMDLVVIDFEYGTGDLYKNAELTRMVIREVNKRKWANGSTQKNVVMGHSMGGVLARMALREMEIWGENHDASDYISNDAPHLGANLPVSTQYLMQDYIDLFNAGNVGVFSANTVINVINPLIDIINLTNAIPVNINNINNIDYLEVDQQVLQLMFARASRQLTIYRINDNSESINFRNYLNTIGFPQNTINTGLANGNSVGESNENISPSGLLLDLNDPAGLTNSAPVSVFNGVNIGASAALKFPKRFRCWATSLPSNASHKIYHSKIKSQFKLKINIYIKVLGKKIKINSTIKFFDILLWERKKYESDYIEGPVLKAFDSSPGGFWPLPVDDEITENFPEVTKVDNFSFTPIVSALNISSEIDNPYYNFGSGDVSVFTGNAKSTFDRVKIFETTVAPDNVYNADHILITGKSSLYIQNLIKGSIPSPIGSNLTSSFNYGTSINGSKTSKYIGSTTINSGVSLSIQKNINIGYANSNLPAKDHHHFVLETEKDCNGTPVNITFNAGSTLETGNGWGYSGDFIINPNATVRFKSGSKIRLRNHSQLIVRSGGKLIIEPNVDIILEGDHSVMRFMDYETLELTDNCTFKMDDKGHLAFHGSWNPDYPKSILFGENARLELTGDDNYNDKLLELHGLFKLSGNQTNRIKIKRGMVSIDLEQHISIGGMKVQFNRTLFTCSDSDEKYAGISLWGQNNILIFASKFHHAHTGIVNNAGTSVFPIRVFSSQFSDCTEGLKLQGGRASVKTSEFLFPMDIGIKADGLVNQSEFKTNRFQSNLSHGMVLSGQTGSVAILKENEFYSDKGITTTNLELNLRCNSFDTENACVSLNGGTLILNNKGVNTFNNSNYYSAQIAFLDLEGLFASGGNNEFGSSNTFMSGNFLLSALGTSFYSPIGGGPNSVALNFDENRYASGKLNMTIPNYSILIDHTSQPTTTMCPLLPKRMMPQVSSTFPNISTNYFSNENLYDAVELALDFTTDSTVISNPNETACKYLIDILEHYPALSTADLQLVHDFAYSKMHETYNLAFANFEIPRNEVDSNTSLPDLLLQANAYINGRIALLQPSNVNDARLISKLIIDKAFLNRSAGFYHYAETLLGQSENFDDLEMLARSQYWNCLVNAEKQLYYGLISEVAFLELDKACEQNYGGAKLAQNNNFPVNEDYNSVKTDASHFDITRTPSGVELTTQQWKADRLTVYNGLGEVILILPAKKSKISLDMSRYSRGVYFISNAGQAKKFVW